MSKCFLILNGNNNAIYIINIKTTSDVTSSLKFYKALSSTRRVFKSTLCAYLHALGLVHSIFPCICKNNYEIQDFLAETIGQDCDFGIDEHCSALVSPTRDKVIVQHHNQYFHKYGFGESYPKVKKEFEIYQHLKSDYEYLSVSKAGEYEDTGVSCSFKLFTDKKCDQQPLLKISSNKLLNALVEFNKAIQVQEKTVSAYIGDILSRFREPEFESAAQRIIERNGKDKLLIGLTHNDFKPWNVLAGEERVLFFDFEECTTSGMIGTDFFNYFIDPLMLNFKDYESVERVIERDDVKDAYGKYTKEIDIKSQYYLILSIYLLEKCFQYHNENNYSMESRHISLLETIIEKLAKSD